MKNTVGLLLLALFSNLTAHGQGSLYPVGMPAPSMKTLDEVEPRVPVASLPFVIDSPGSYYLAASLTSATNGIVITADHVLLDLMGFSITSDTGGGSGIVLDGAFANPVRHVRIQNGVIAGFSAGLLLHYVEDCQFERLTLTQNGDGVRASPGSAITACLFSDFSCSNNTNDGFAVRGGIAGNTVFSHNRITRGLIRGNNVGIHILEATSYCDGNLFEDLLITQNRSHGLNLFGSSMAARLLNNQVRRCRIHNNTGIGLNIWAPTSIIVEQNTIYGNSGGGINATGGTGLFTANISMGNSGVGNFNLTGVTYGPIVTNTGALPSSGDAAHPWANFSR